MQEVEHRNTVLSEGVGACIFGADDGFFSGSRFATLMVAPNLRSMRQRRRLESGFTWSREQQLRAHCDQLNSSKSKNVQLTTSNVQCLNWPAAGNIQRVACAPQCMSRARRHL
jgi:hypothetical protein